MLLFIKIGSLLQFNLYLSSMTKFKNKYRIESNRKPGWNYGDNALYFVTICTKNRICYFGNVVNTKMQLSEIGRMAEKFWLEIPQHFPFVILHAHVVMPNHVHGIIEIAKRDDDRIDVETQNFASLPETTNQYKNNFGPQSQNLASIIRGYKIGVKKNARLVRPKYAWQSNYHDHIIRNNKSYINITNYIKNNPGNWNDDQFYKKP